MNEYNPIYELNDHISRLVGEIESLESLIADSYNIRNFLKEKWKEWRNASIINAFKMQKWGLKDEDILAYLRGNLLTKSAAASVQRRIKNYAAVLDFINNQNPISIAAFEHLSAIHARLRVGVEGGDLFAGQLRPKFLAIYKPNRRHVKF